MLAQLTAEEGGAIPLTVLAPGRLAPWLAEAASGEREWLDAIGFTGEAGKIALIPATQGGLARVVLGGEAEERLWSLAALPETLPAGRYALDCDWEPAGRTLAALGWALGAYAFTRYKQPPAEGRRRVAPVLVWPAGVDRGEVERLARAVGLARDLINTPAEDMGPADLAAAAEQIAAESGARCCIVAGEALLAAGYPAIHAVGRASSRSPRLIDVTWGAPDAPRVTLVGKGVCFDTGGLDLKPSSNMRLMKKDMGGAAILLGLAQALMAARLPIRLRLLIPAVDNAVAGNAMRPLDVIRTRGGKTVEIGNTDAEGRLILGDALVEACGDRPALLVDCATLTGAARVALGPDLPALFVNDDALAEGLLGASRAVADPLWRLPLWQPYRRLIDSKVADLNNVADSPHAGAILAALYLQEFVAPGTPWAHLDVLAWNGGARPGRPEGGEAMGLRALYAYIVRRFG